MKSMNPAGLWSGTHWLAGLFLLALALPAFSGDDYDQPCPPCKEWDESAHDCVYKPGTPCVILDWFGSDSTSDKCFKVLIKIRGECYPVCGSIIITRRYLDHKTWCPGSYSYEYDYHKYIYTWTEIPCVPSFNKDKLLEDLSQNSETEIHCQTILLDLLDGNMSDPATAAPCLEGLANQLHRDPCDYWNGCEQGTPIDSGIKYECTLYGDGCGED